MKNLYNQHPNLLMWAALALGMVAVLLVAARDVGFTTGQWAALLGATIALAGLCVWIISWESDA
jgi:drug/metabolite transporter (DMT)-like permease